VLVLANVLIKGKIMQTNELLARLFATVAFILILPISARASGPIIGWGNSIYVAESELTDLIAIDAGKDHCLGLRVDGSIVAWGANYRTEKTASYL
jgi:alpha-tubulin suppressor-like RCC1 family protein